MADNKVIKCSHFPETVIPDDVSVPEFMLQEMTKFGNNVATIEEGGKKILTYANLIEEIRELACGLQEKGLKKGDVAGIVSSNCSEYFTITVAVQRLGGIVTTANPGYTAEELIKQFTDSKPKFLFVQPESFMHFLDVKLQLATIQKTFIITTETNFKNSESVDDLKVLGRKNIRNVNLPKINPRNDPCLILYSSGTTGLPKGVVLTHYNIVANLCQLMPARQSQHSHQATLQCTEQDILYSCLPHFHIGGIMFSLFWPLTQGTKILIFPRFNLEQVLEAAQKFKVTILIFVPPVLVLVSKSVLVEKYDLRSVRAIICGAAPVPKDEAKNCSVKLSGNPHVIQVYGMTELSPGSHMMVFDERSRDRINSIGAILPSTECKVVNTETGQLCGPNERGEIWVRGPQVMKEYLNNPEATKQTKLPDGFLRTGDIGYYDSDGFFYMVDRLKELIKVRGFQVAPAELEELILTHPSVADVVVVGVPDKYSGELPRAYVVLIDGHSVTEKDIKNHVVGHVARYKELAGGVTFVKELPKTASGKHLRRILREEAAKEKTGQKSRL